MRFKNDETDLERELRSQRPQPREQFVQMLAGHKAVSRQPRRRVAPALAFVAVVTALFAASLGSAGAVGAATHSVVTLCKSVAHVVDYGNNHGNGGNDGNNGGDPGGPGDPGGFFHFPFQHQYGHVDPVCLDRRIQLFLPRAEAIYLETHFPLFYKAGFCFR